MDDIINALVDLADAFMRAGMDPPTVAATFRTCRMLESGIARRYAPLEKVPRIGRAGASTQLAGVRIIELPE